MSSRSAAARRVAEADRRLRRRARATGQRRHLTAVALPAFRLLVRHRARAPGGYRIRGRAGVRPSGRLARFSPPDAGRPARRRPRGLPRPPRSVAPRRGGPRGLAAGPHRVPDRRCGHAATASGRVVTQPGAAHRRELFDQDAVPRLAPRRPPLPRPACRWGHREQPDELAMGCRDRNRHPTKPGY